MYTIEFQFRPDILSDIRQNTVPAEFQKMSIQYIPTDHRTQTSATAGGVDN